MFLNTDLKYPHIEYKYDDPVRDKSKWEGSIKCSKKLYLTTGQFSSVKMMDDEVVTPDMWPEILYGYKITKNPGGVWKGGCCDTTIV
jgi:hypothetical protein